MSTEKALYVYCNCGKTSKYEYDNSEIRFVKTMRALTLTMPACPKCNRVTTYSSETDNGVTLKMLLNWLIRKGL